MRLQARGHPSRQEWTAEGEGKGGGGWERRRVPREGEGPTLAPQHQGVTSRGRLAGGIPQRTLVARLHCQHP